MTQYVDGFAFPIPSDRVSDYKRLADSVAEIWIEHGALAYNEYIGDDMNLAGTRSFAELLDTSENESVVFGWVVFSSREARDKANERVAADPRMMALLKSSQSGFDAERMAYGGFKALVQHPDVNVK